MGTHVRYHDIFFVFRIIESIVQWSSLACGAREYIQGPGQRGRCGAGTGAAPHGHGEPWGGSLPKKVSKLNTLVCCLPLHSILESMRRIINVAPSLPTPRLMTRRVAVQPISPAATDAALAVSRRQLSLTRITASHAASGLCGLAGHWVVTRGLGLVVLDGACNLGFFARGVEGTAHHGISLRGCATG